MVVSELNAELVVLLLERNIALEFVGGAYVFPGGKVEPQDSSSDVVLRCDGQTDESASSLLGLERGGLSYFVAGIRECFEETGILLARSDGSGILDASGTAFVETLSEASRSVIGRYRQRLVHGECDFVTVVKELGLTLACDRLRYVAHWITPTSSPRRFDTRFFVTVTESCPLSLVDEEEVVKSIWIAPSQALEESKSGSLTMILPTIRNLESLEAFSNIAQLEEYLSHPLVVVPIRPELVPGDHGDEIRVSQESETRWSHRFESLDIQPGSFGADR
jgi:8-oxo-dGTP pyrophosphatase MutT (NUDIX family)